jgi:hypothetical protein
MTESRHQCPPYAHARTYEQDKHETEKHEEEYH